ncbi:MAG: hypothetical protein HY864_09785 [Chloroflexi bacterium]|nr:hypothetical protein [Chloroflexota bacterium]
MNISKTQEEYEAFLARSLPKIKSETGRKMVEYTSLVLENLPETVSIFDALIKDGHKQEVISLMGILGTLLEERTNEP